MGIIRNNTLKGLCGGKTDGRFPFLPFLYALEDLGKHASVIRFSKKNATFVFS